MEQLFARYAAAADEWNADKLGLTGYRSYFSGERNHFDMTLHEKGLLT
jgi:hypothetical protein